MLRLILDRKKSDLTPRTTLLEESGIKSVNAIAAQGILLEVWKSFEFGIESIIREFQYDQGLRREGYLRTSTDKFSFISAAATLWNLNHTSLKSEPNVKNAKVYISNFTKLLPV